MPTDRLAAHAANKAMIRLNRSEEVMSPRVATNIAKRSAEAALCITGVSSCAMLPNTKIRSAAAAARFDVERAGADTP